MQADPTTRGPASPARRSRWLTNAPVTAGLIRPRRELSPLQFGLLVAVAALVLSSLTGGSWYFQWTFAVINGILAFGVGMALNWAGLPALGMGLFYAVGGYWAALMRGYNLPPLVLLLAGAALGLVGALILAQFTVSLGFHSFAMLSLVIAQAGYQVIFSTAVFGRENGLYGVARGSVFGLSLTSNQSFFYYCAAVLVVLTVLGRLFYQSAAGRALRAGRDDAVKAESLGVNVRQLKSLAYALGGATAAIAGVLYAQFESVVDPSMANWSQSASAVMMVVLGGLGTFYGPTFGGVVFGWITLRVNSLTQEPLFWIGLIFVIVVLVTPGGLSDIVRRGVQLVKRRLNANGGPPWTRWR